MVEVTLHPNSFIIIIINHNNAGDPHLYLVMVFERCAKDVDATSEPSELAAFENLLSKCTSPPRCKQAGCCYSPRECAFGQVHIMIRCTHADAAALLAKRLKIIPNLARGGGWIVRRTVQPRYGRDTAEIR